jgi:hypothetical protein
MKTNMNRYLAASDALEVLEANREAGLPVSVDQLLDVQRRLSEAQSRYFQSIAEYTIATKNVQFEKGTLLETVNLAIVDPLAPPGDELIFQEVVSEPWMIEPSMIEEPVPAEPQL